MPATVHLGYHDPIDSLTGALLAFATVPVAFSVMRRRGELALATGITG